MNTLDLIILVILAFFMFNSFRNGFIEEILALTTLFISFFIAYRFYPLLMPFLDFISPNELAQKLTAFVIIFTLTYILLKLLKEFLFNFIENNDLSDIDRILGLALGFFKGIVIISFLILLLSYINYEQLHNILENSLISQKLLPLINRYKQLVI